MSTYQPDLTKRQIEEIGRKLAKDRLGLIDSLQDEIHPRDTFYTRYCKRAIDVLVASVALIVSAPVNLVIAIATMIDVGRPILFKQERAGKDGRVFHIVKFRNMRDDRDEKGDLLPPNMRVTKWGSFVRKTSLDELLNFWSVLKGDMSLIGPRPLPPVYLERFSRRHMARLSIRPGLECPPRSVDDRVRTWNEQFENDVWYVENVSFATDCRMILNLFKFAFNRKNAAMRAVAERGSFMGYGLDGKVINDAEIPSEYIEWVKGVNESGKKADGSKWICQS